MTKDEIIEAFDEKLEAQEAAAARDRARQTTVTVDFVDSLFGDHLTVTVTGIAPFEALPSCGALTGVEGWRIFGQPWPSQCGLRCTTTSAVRYNGPLPGRVFGGVPLLREDDARRLAAALNAQIAEVA